MNKVIKDNNNTIVIADDNENDINMAWDLQVYIYLPT